MGLEAATYINDLVITNPLATDKKNVGDDHLRLIKTAAKNTLPNADRPFYFPKVVNKTTDYTIVDVDDNKIITCDTSGGVITLTLPDGATIYNGWSIIIVKVTGDVNPVFVVPPSGTISGLAKIRCNVPSHEERIYWDGSNYKWFSPGASAVTIQWHAGSVPAGFGLANGQSLLQADHPLLFAFWGTTHGAVDGTHFNAPNLLDRFPVGAGNLYVVGATGGEAAHTLTIAELAAHAHAISQNPHDHAITSTPDVSATNFITAGGPAASANPQYVNLGSNIDVSPANADITITNAGSDNAHENRPPYFALNPIFRLC